MSNDNTQQRGSTRFIEVGDETDESYQGGKDKDVVDLGGGDDTIAGGGGRHYNIILGGSGNDHLTSQALLDEVFGGSGNDTIIATGRGGWLYGGSGDDIIDGSEGVDEIVGGTGNDTLTGGGGGDVFVFSEDHGNDTITDFNAADGDKIHLYFDKTITWEQLQSTFTTVTDDDGAVTGVQIDLTQWGGGTIVLEGVTSVSDLTEDMFSLDNTEAYVGLNDVQVHFGTEGDDKLESDGSGGADRMFGMEGDDTLLGGKGKDWLFGGEGEDTLYGGKGGDTLLGGEGGDTLMGGGGGDTLMGGGGNDELHGGKGVDLLIGGTGDDKLYGGRDNDILDGGEGADTLDGGGGNDTLGGGGGVDTFVFQKNHGSDTILDFDTSLDKVDLSDLAQTVTWEKLQAAITATTNSDGAVTGARIDLSEWGGGTVTLMGVAPTDLTEDMFILDDNPVAELAGDDIMTGGEGADTFVFAGAHGNDTITDFTDGEDLIDLSAFANIAKFGDLAATQVGDDVRIDLSDHGGGTITLQDFTLGDLDETDFVFQTSSQDVQDGM